MDLYVKWLVGLSEAAIHWTERKVGTYQMKRTGSGVCADCPNEHLVCAIFVASFITSKPWLKTIFFSEFLMFNKDILAAVHDFVMHSLFGRDLHDRHSVVDIEQKMPYRLHFQFTPFFLRFQPAGHSNKPHWILDLWFFYWTSFVHHRGKYYWLRQIAPLRLIHCSVHLRYSSMEFHSLTIFAVSTEDTVLSLTECFLQTFLAPFIEHVD